MSLVSFQTSTRRDTSNAAVSRILNNMFLSEQIGILAMRRSLYVLGERFFCIGLSPHAMRAESGTHLNGEQTC
jgi:hypothetical protein